jgi:hypothetical protein
MIFVSQIECDNTPKLKKSHPVVDTTWIGKDSTLQI